MDSTYKTNLYRMPLFEIVGVTSTYLTYSVGFSFMTSKKEDNFTWDYQMLLKLLGPNSDMGEEESNEDLFSVAEEWRGIQERLERVPFQMKLEIKEGLQLLAFSETTMLSPPPRNVPTKGAPKN